MEMVIKMKTVFIDGKEWVDLSLLEPLKQYGEVEVFEGIPGSDEEAAKRAKGADVIAFGLMQISNGLIDMLSDLKVLQFIGTGVNTFVDVDYAAKKGIKVLNIEGYGNMAVAEYAIACMFTLNRQIVRADNSMKAGKWTLTGLEGAEIDKSTIGVVGTGNIGAIVAKKAVSLGATVLAFDVFKSEALQKEYGVKYTELDEIFKKCDIITLHLKVNQNTTKIINERLISSMKENAILINVGRSELVDNEALYQALVQSKIRGAAIDVYDQEPPKDARLAQLDNVIASPHIAYYTRNATDNSIAMSVDSIIKAIESDKGVDR